MFTSQPRTQSTGDVNCRPTHQPPESRQHVNFADFLPLAKIRTMGPRQHLFREGDDKADIYQILRGTFVLYRLLPNGRRQVTGFAVTGDIVGLGTGRHHPSSAESSSEAQVRALPAVVLHRLAGDDPNLALLLYDAMSRELLTVQDHLVMVSLLYAVERVAMFLVGLSNRGVVLSHLACDIELPMKRHDIADFLSLATETVSRSLTKLVKGGVIARQPGGIRVLDQVLLRGLAKGGFKI